MQSTEREEFNALLDKLCSGFNVPKTEARTEAYWIGLGKMSLVQFSRAIDEALGEQGQDRIPTPPQLWKILKSAKAQSTTIVQKKAAADQRDHIEYYANRLLFDHIASRKGLGSTSKYKPGFGLIDCVPSSELDQCLKFKRSLVEFFTPGIVEGDELATPREFMTMSRTGLHKLSPIDAGNDKKLRDAIADERSAKPFSAFMGRSLTQPSMELVPL